jgi:anti-sigma factor (TIGR02949 family)
MDCRDALSKLYDYIDGEIGSAEREAIAVHVQACRGCFDQFETERLFSEVLEQRTPRPHARAEFKAHLLSRLSEESAVDRRPLSIANITSIGARFAMAAVMVLAIGVGAAWVDREAGPQAIPWRTLAGYHHERAEVEEVGLETADYEQARAFLAAQMNPGVATLLPASAPAGVGLKECCVMPWANEKLGRLAFDGGAAGDVSLFVIPASSFRFSDEARVRFANHDYRSKKLGCCRAVCWDEAGEYVCIMFGDCQANDLLAYAESWKAAHNVRSSDGSVVPKPDSYYSTIGKARQP